jgi:cytoskeletal protein RodZ
VSQVNIGETLREARLSKNLSLDELQQITKVQKRFLEAIENNQFHVLPSDFYVRAFIRQYATAVDVDGNYLVDVFDGKDVVLPVREKPEEVQQSRKEIHVEDRKVGRIFTSLPAILLGIVAVAIIAVVAYVTISNKNSNPIISQNSSVKVEGSVTNTAATSSTSSATSSTTATSSKVSSTKKSSSTKASSSSSAKEKMTIAMDSNTSTLANMTLKKVTSPAKFKFTAKDGRCWLGVAINGAYAYQVTLEEGDSGEYSLPAGTTGVEIVMGAAQYVSFTVNGDKVDFQGDAPSGTNQKNVGLTLEYK